MRALIKVIVALVIAIGIGACGYFYSSPRLGSYRAVLKVPGGELPLQFDFVKEAGRYVLYIVNGAQRTRMSDVDLSQGTLRARFPGFSTTLHATVNRGEWNGNVSLITNAGEQSVAFAAKHGVDYRFFATPASDNADVAGRWNVSFIDDDGRATPAVADFRQSHDQVTGTVVTAAGDQGYLAGQVSGEDFFLSSFTGGEAHLYKARVDSDGNIEGEYWSGNEHSRWHAKRDAEAELDQSAYLPKLTGNGIFNFTFPNLDRVPVSLADMRFQGKVVLVTVAGTWSGGSHEEAAALASLYEQYRGRGLEVISLMFERSHDFDKAAEAVQRFRKDYGIDYITLLAGPADLDAASKALPSLDRVYAFPTTLFIDRQGLVRKIHTGFTGPASGERYRQTQAEFRTLIEQLLNTSEGRRESPKNFRYASNEAVRRSMHG
jgi:peroxiredoxin